MLSRLLREFLFNLLHLLVGVYEIFKIIKFWLWNSALINNRVTENDIQVLLKNVPRSENKLEHLVVLADTERNSIADFARVLIWSLIAGIPFVSFYDITGSLKQNEEHFFIEVEKNKIGVPGCIKWLNKPDLNGYNNGSKSYTIVVNIFTKEDGQPVIAECIKLIAKNEIECIRNSTEFTAHEFNSAIERMYTVLPEPNLVLYTGQACCTYGFLPWQIRLSEFVQLSLDNRFNVYNYVNALRKYYKCDQRFGT